MEDKKESWDHYIIIILIAFMFISCIAIYSAQTIGQYEQNFVIKQVVWYLIGFLLVFVVSKIDIDYIYQSTWILYIIGNLVLLFLIFAPESIADPVYGAKSWFQIPKIGSIQPSEIFKPIFILTLSLVTSKHNNKYLNRNIKSDILLLVKNTLILFYPLSLILQQPDFGTSLTYICVFAGIILVSGITWKIILPILLFLSSSLTTVIYLALEKPKILKSVLSVEQYQLNRLYAWLNPSDNSSSFAFQINKSLLAIGSGQVTGKGFNQNQVYIPEAHNDFIFSILGEEYGFIGASLVVILYFILISRITITGLKTGEKSEFSSYICTGVMTLIAFHVFQNVGMLVNLLPITGIPLPFLSYGGSAMIGFMLCIALVVNISKNLSNRNIF